MDMFKERKYKIETIVGYTFYLYITRKDTDSDIVCLVEVCNREGSMIDTYKKAVDYGFLLRLDSSDIYERIY